MSRRIPGSRVEELAAKAEGAAAHAKALEAALERERGHAAELEPRRQAAIDAHSAACADYERLRDETPPILEDASEAVDALVLARTAIGEARRQLERLGVKAERVTPKLLQQTDAGARTLEATRSKLLTRI